MMSLTLTLQGITRLQELKSEFWEQAFNMRCG
jgi:hypothetical protein